MPIYQTFSVTAAGIAITLTDNADLTIAPGILVGSEINAGVAGLGSHHRVQVYGLVSGNVGVVLGTDFTVNSNNIVQVMDEGSVYGSTYGIGFWSLGNQVINDGNISSQATGVHFRAFDVTFTSYVTNRGTITGSIGIRSVGEAVNVFNDGVIEGSGSSSFAILSSSAADSVTNRGTLRGLVDLGTGLDTLKNLGAIFGDVLLGGDNDLYDGRGGTIDGFIFGGDGNDRLYTGAGDNEIHGEAGNDTLIGGAGRNVLSGGTGTDRVSYTSASTGVSVNLSKPGLNTGDAKGDTYTSIEEVIGSYFNDNLTGNNSNNAIIGSEGNDVLNGALGLTGGDGEDTFVFKNTPNASTNIDTITDFNVADDVIRIDNSVFLGLPTGTLASAAFRANTTGNAADASDRIIYETDTGKLFFDADGNGAGAKIQFATLDPALSLTNADFIVI